MADPLPPVSVTPSPAAPSATPPLPVDMAQLKALGGLLFNQFKTYESHRRLVELKWARNLRQFLGEYDPEVIKTLEANRSRAYPRITRIKCVSMLARLMNLLFPTTEKNWGLEASPVPNLSMEDLQDVLKHAQEGSVAAQNQLTSAVIEGAVRAFATVRAGNLETEISDQLLEVGGSRNMSYVHLCRKVLFSGILYGAGVLKGPFTREQKQRTWALNTENQYAPQEHVVYRPQFDFVSIWDYYPDMTSKHLHDMDGQYHRMVLTKSQFRALADRSDFFANVITQYLAKNPKGNWKEKSHESELRTMGTQASVNVLSTEKFEVLVWDGMVSSQTLMAANIELPAGRSNDMADTSVWMIDGEIIRCDISPWVELEPDQRIPIYHHFIFEEDDTSLIGNGLPNIMRDSQMGVSSATRMLMDNASVVCGPQLEVNLELLRTDQDTKAIMPYKVWYRDDGSASTAAIPAVREINIESHVADLSKVVELFANFADQETFVNPATGGDMQKGPSEPFRTAAGASMLRGEASLPFKDVVRNYDAFTTSVINSLVLFNKHFNPNREVQGDCTVIARGSSSLIAKEVRGMALDNLAQTIQPEERKFVDWYKHLQERIAVRDVDVSSVLLSPDDAAKAIAAEQQRTAEDDARMKELMSAEVRKLLADAVKSLAASDAASSRGEADLYNAALKGLEIGVTPTDVHAARAGGQLPAAVAAGLRRQSGADPKPAAKSAA